MTRRALLYHSHKAWADKIERRLLDLGCSPKYAARVAGRIRREGEAS